MNRIFDIYGVHYEDLRRHVEFIKPSESLQGHFPGLIDVQPFSTTHIQRGKISGRRKARREDDQIDLVGMIRVAKREAKFDFRGRDGQSSNSLFRGFKGEADEEIV